LFGPLIAVTSKQNCTKIINLQNRPVSILEKDKGQQWAIFIWISMLWHGDALKTTAEAHQIQQACVLYFSYLYLLQRRYTVVHVESPKPNGF